MRSNQWKLDGSRSVQGRVPGPAVWALLLLGLVGGCGSTSFPSATSAPAPPLVVENISPTTTVLALRADQATVVSITDGDTIRVTLADGTNEPVRLIGIDAPESGQPFSAEAKDLLTSLLEGQTVRLVRDESDRDNFGRLLRYVYLGEQFVNRLMVESGLAVARAYPPDTAHSASLDGAANDAEISALGLWSVPTTTTTAATTTTTTSQPPTTTVAPTTTVTTTTTIPATTTTTTPPAQNCHSSYEGACLLVGAGDYDCAGGSGNGPYYVTGPVYVVGPDEFDLDRDGDGVGCES